MGICICGSPRPGEHCDECDVTHPDPAITRSEAEARLTDDVLEHIWRGGIMSPTEAEQHVEMRQRLLDALFG